jgi:hypothetical protein
MRRQNSTTWELDKEIKHLDRGVNGQRVAHTWSPARRRHRDRREATEQWKLKRAQYT